MKKQTMLLGVLVITFSFLLFGCGIKNQDNSYNVWTSTDSYADFQIVFGDLDDDYFTKITFNDNGWSQFQPVLNSCSKYKWDYDMIKKWFIGREFIDSQANELTSWLVTTNHGMVSLRKGNTVYSIIKE